MRLARAGEHRYRDRGHFFCTASRAMRQVLIDRARQRLAGKRGGGMADIDIEIAGASTDPLDIDLVALDRALGDLERDDPGLARMVEWRFFAGLTLPEIAEASGVSLTTVKRDLVEAGAYLRVRMDGATG
jgi:RNA polymerase sigma factor (TIGR02999 family)